MAKPPKLDTSRKIPPKKIYALAVSTLFKSNLSPSANIPKNSKYLDLVSHSTMYFLGLVSYFFLFSFAATMPFHSIMQLSLTQTFATIINTIVNMNSDVILGWLSWPELSMNKYEMSLCYE